MMFLVRFTNEIKIKADSPEEAKSKAQDIWIKDPPDPKITVKMTVDGNPLNN